MAGKFELYKDKTGHFRFRLKARNGEIILASQAYTAKAACQKGIASVRKNCGKASCFEKTDTASGKFRFTLKSANGQVIGTSQTYESETGRDNGVDSVARSAPGADVTDTT